MATYPRCYDMPRVPLDSIREDVRRCGMKNRLLQLDEELKELGLAISHALRTDRTEGVTGKGGIAEELADVLILCAVVSCGLRDEGHGHELDLALHDKLMKWKFHVLSVKESAN